MEEHHFSFNQ